MSDWNTDRASALMRLRRAQTRVVTSIAPGIATEDGAAATPSVLELDGPRGGRFIGQRVRVERSGAWFAPDASFAAAETEWNSDDSSCRLYVPKADGTMRLQITTANGEFHSVTLLHGGRVLQLTSFSEELDVPQTAEALADADEPNAGSEAAVADDAFSADTLAEPPEFTPEQLRAAAETGTTGGTAHDPRPEHLAAEERRLGPDYGYRLRSDAPRPSA